MGPDTNVGPVRERAGRSRQRQRKVCGIAGRVPYGSAPQRQRVHARVRQVVGIVPWQGHVLEQERIRAAAARVRSGPADLLHARPAAGPDRKQQGRHARRGQDVNGLVELHANLHRIARRKSRVGS